MPFLGIDRLGFVRREAGLDQRLRRRAGASSLQFVQMRRTRRWAQIRLTELATRNGSMPMFIRRVIVLGRVVGVQRREHQVAGERGLDRDLRRLEVADFADQDDVRVLAQERAQRGGEVQPDLLVHLHLVDARRG